MQISRLATRLVTDKALWAAVMAAPVALWLLFWWQPELRSVGVQWPKEAIMLIILLPLVEELAFRGYLQGYLAQFSVRRFSVGLFSGQNLITTAVFSSLHLFSHSAFWSLVVVIPSLVFGFFKDRYQSVIPAVILHVYFNGLYFYFFATN